MPRTLYAGATGRTGASITLNEGGGAVKQTWVAPSSARASDASLSLDRATSLPERHLTHEEQRIFHQALFASTTSRGRGSRK
jgi:hypothetical protein